MAAQQKIGDYEIERVVGSGSFGKAVLVKDKNGHRQIMKLINTTRMTPEEVEEAKNEVQVLTKLVDSPFTVSYKGAFASTYLRVPHLCIVMEYCAGGDLGKLIKDRKRQGKPFSETTLRTWLLQLTLSLHFMHKHKILHRDLKPANVFLDQDNYIRVGDLGLSKILEFTLQQAKTQCGTPAFMAPELCQGKPYQTPADIWALGCIMVEAATFELPFRGITFPELNRNICHAPAPKLPTRYSLDLRTICESMLAKDPKKRPTTEDILNSPAIRAQYHAYKGKYSHA
ncbi:CMGC kinase, CK2 family [Toxoplasma gondii TgCatPRC2]|uniref:non-specific serine/threonine protein kinase n=15 Tax=Toxoplasma gondii TaxID=5811 RepID=A0A125YT87_TOXGV|nr:CMGC kinase, CK2 family [Toxoplasma gondii ME49]EPR56925.1 CMGC kinase, CK2 family [Toxoplasma gondii GT1]ESS29095.1 CMGC kinase, CK2 family [Toxoplasma gondii VEG]KAF4646339.1 CMGC kinase, CK2 family [Toxoplasma gondii]KFG27837.1 CMGC kinase, CK2 family [Toxoplasma gondii p89]KFG29462.1 CMGC kinase, CK2 family [Toxoplasma gondii GAB2-2007-GAL-DOM2]KFG32013.1 CMGC kinase, CK2 family [Toxoplasma gondii FOU]KFG59193.1 CMGC kinase, CK2 family [Toxoplasma gondii RUB]KFH00975.1 CMGC kinase, C|eukprot:XP_008888862.1 CMGC kinase, CK2 family [Hammondia hammondi]